MFEAVDWRKLLVPGTPLLEIVIRGSVVYLGLFLMLRCVLKREAGSVAITDLLVVVLLADAAQNAMGGDYHSLPDGLILVAVIVFWAYFLNWLGFRYPRFQELVHPSPLCLVKDGKMVGHNLRKEFLTEDELKSVLRQQGVEDISKVRKAFMEGDGKISVITDDGERHQEPRRGDGQG